MDMNPDFEVRNLEDYTWDELETLQWAITLAKIEVVSQSHTRQESTLFQKLDIWHYRLKDAMAVARKRENETH